MNYLNIFLTLMGLFMAASAAPTNIEIGTDKVVARDDGPHAMCTNGQVICAAQADNGYDGGVFECVDGRLVLIQDCSPSEKCIKDPSPHCAWARTIV
ncbi:hypothetical protein NX059_011706 [Plenodomus lindquistii]|nr:hypothetical protein NX059_011706 [Plenodomus lindquistii]